MKFSKSNDLVISFLIVGVIFFISALPTNQQPFNCYQCASNSLAACADPSNTALLQSNVMSGCVGACIVYKLTGTVYRGCSTNTTLSGLIGTATSGAVTFTYCKINLCNYIAAPTPATSTVSPTTALATTAAPTSTTTSFNCYDCNSNTPGCGSPFSSSGLNTVACHGSCVVYATDKIYRGCTNMIVGGSGTVMVNTVKMNYCSTNLCNSGPAPVTVATTTTAPAGINCYSCNTNTYGCSNPFVASGLSTINCLGACIVWINPYDGKLYRGCTNKIPLSGSPSSGTTYTNGIGINYCQTNLCNTGVAPPPSSTTVPLTSTAAIATTTQGGSGSATTTSLTTCLNNPSNLVSWTEFSNAVTQNGYPQPTQTQYCNYVSQLTSAGGITTKLQAAMFLAQILWESGGLQYMRELACIQTNCPSSYDSNPSAGLYYYGRGYIQLSWDYNYKAASEALYGDDRLLYNPDLVASNDTIAWATAFWYWKTSVATNPQVQAGYFGSSTNAINGALECQGAYQSKAQGRYGLYKVVFAAFNLPGSPIENGCYN